MSDPMDIRRQLLAGDRLDGCGDAGCVIKGRCTQDQAASCAAFAIAEDRASRDHWKARAEAAEAREQAWKEAAEALERHPKHAYGCAAYGHRTRRGLPPGQADASCGRCKALALLAHARSLGRPGG